MIEGHTMTRSRSTRLADERGQMIVLLALSFVVLIGFMGLVIDAGRIYLQRRSAQLAADAAAAAVAQEAARDTGSDLTAVATYYVNQNGLAGAQTDVTVNNPPTSGVYTSDDTAYEVV